jgi:hypothetical protein
MTTGTPVPRRTPPLLAAVLLAVSLAYPVVVYLALGHVSPRWIALLLVALALARAWVTRESFWLVAATPTSRPPRSSTPGASRRCGAASSSSTA